jgi:hypothetical protein
VLHRLQLETAKAERAGRSAIIAAWIAGGMCAIGIAEVAGFALAGIGHGF